MSYLRKVELAKEGHRGANRRHKEQRIKASASGGGGRPKPIGKKAKPATKEERASGLSKFRAWLSRFSRGAKIRMQCTKCHGNGYVGGRFCSPCNGKGMVSPPKEVSK